MRRKKTIWDIFGVFANIRPLGAPNILTLMKASTSPTSTQSDIL